MVEINWKYHFMVHTTPSGNRHFTGHLNESGFGYGETSGKKYHFKCNETRRITPLCFIPQHMPQKAGFIILSGYKQRHILRNVTFILEIITSD